MQGRKVWRINNTVSIPLVLQMTIKYKFKRIKTLTKTIPLRTMRPYYVLLLTQGDEIDVDRVSVVRVGTIGIDGKRE
jgi:hypothetical protein